jgi:hypothetical protein
MNKPITIRVRTAMSSPAKVTGAAGDLMKKSGDAETSASKPLINPGVNLGGGNSSLISGASDVSGTSGGVERADLTVTAPSTNTGSKTIGEAFQSNLAQRIDKQGELGRARREARRNKKAGIPESTAPSAEKAARDARVDNILSKNTSSSSLNNTMPKADFSGMGSDAPGKPTPSAKADAAPSAKSIRQAGRADRAQVRQDNKSEKQAARVAGKNLKNADRIFGKNGVEVTADKGPSNRAIKRSARKESNASEKASRQEIKGVEKSARQETRAINKEGRLRDRGQVGSDGEVISNKEMRSRGKEFKKLQRAENKADRQSTRDQKSLGKAINKLENSSSMQIEDPGVAGDPMKAESMAGIHREKDRIFNERKNTALDQANSMASNIGTADRSSYSRTTEPGVEADGTPTRERNGSVVSAAQMRMNANVGIKSKSPMKKGYFKGM